MSPPERDGFRNRQPRLQASPGVGRAAFDVAGKHILGSGKGEYRPRESGAGRLALIEIFGAIRRHRCYHKTFHYRNSSRRPARVHSCLLIRAVAGCLSENVVVASGDPTEHCRMRATLPCSSSSFRRLRIQTTYETFSTRWSRLTWAE